MENKKLTEDTENTTENATDEKYLVFSILGRRFAFLSRFISEITLFETVYPLPLMPAYVPGIINRYSIPYALFDIGLLLFKTPSPRTKVLVLKDDIDRIALLIDDIIGIVDIPQEELLGVETSAEPGDKTEAISGSFNWDGGDVFVLDIQRILSQIAGEL
ncbi:MAG: chemotaxis protein CheW [Treponema sp.]|jgi:purine-binding chemotaxis protein CheW|nr:chemotaxis protein CheW [Treponema sp.]